MRFMLWRSICAATRAVSVAAVLLLAAGPAVAQEAAQIFRQNCMSCHTIGGGRLVGPDLKNVTERQDRQWLARFILEPARVLASGDPYALQLKDEAGGAVMPAIPGLTPDKVQALLDLIAEESARETSQFAGLDITGEPFTAADVARGRRLFRGEAALANGGPSCLSCHTVRGVAALGGGRLGPDLTKVYERMQGRKNLASWLLAPATPTMRPIYAGASLSNDEIVSLVAFLEEEARQEGEATRTAQTTFLLLGLGGAALGFVILDAVWRKRFRAVRRTLVRNATRTR